MTWSQLRGALRPAIALGLAAGSGLWFFAADVSGQDKPSTKPKASSAKTAAPAATAAKPAAATAAPAAKPPTTSPTTKAPAAAAAAARPLAPPQVAMPDANKIVLLLRTSLLTLNDAVRSGNYSVLRDTAAPSFQQNSPARLAEAFAPLAKQGVDLSAVSIAGPQLVEAPVIDQNSRLRLKGYFPLNPLQLNFEVVLEPVDGRWRLAGLAVKPVQAAPVAQAAPAPAAPKAAAKAAAKKP